MNRSNSLKRILYSVLDRRVCDCNGQRAAHGSRPRRQSQKLRPQRSGELAVYTAWDEGDINALIAGFNKVYPNVKVSAMRSEGGRGALLERMLTEIDSGKAMADVYNTGIPDMSCDASAQRDFILPLAERI